MFVVLGTLPYCQADEVLAAAPLDPSLYNTTSSRKKKRSKEAAAKPLPDVKTESIEEIRRKRLAKFCGESSAALPSNSVPTSDAQGDTEIVQISQEESDLDRAIALSLQHS